MPTTNQLVRKGRPGRKRKTKARALKTKRGPAPTLRATVLRTHVIEPRRPNSAKRKVARVRVIQTGRELLCAVPGEGHGIREHDQVLVQPGGYQDVVGVNYSVVRGALGNQPPERTKARSRYGVKR